MSHRPNERVVYFNGEIVPESRALVSFRDRGFKYGEAVFDSTRTVRHRAFKLEEHVACFAPCDTWGSTRGSRWKSSSAGRRTCSSAMLASSVPMRTTGSPSTCPPAPAIPSRQKGALRRPSSECTPLPLRARAPLFRDGVKVQIPAIRRTPPDAQSPRAKTQNYINLLLADREARSVDPLAWAVLLDHSGNIAEGLGSNIFFVREGGLVTPRERFVLPGVSRETVIDLARCEGIPVREADLDLFDAFTADECFLTSTSLCMVPVASINGRRISQRIPGPLTARLMEAYKRLLDFDFVAQYLRHLDLEKK